MESGRVTWWFLTGGERLTVLNRGDNYVVTFN